MTILLDSVKKLELWLMGDMEPMKDFRQVKNKDRDTIERSR